MKSPQQNYAEELYQQLVEHRDLIHCKITLQRNAAHWTCSIEQNDSHVLISCYDVKDAAQYYSEYYRTSKKRAHYCTVSLRETLKSAIHWIQGYQLDLMYERHPFLDMSKRGLQIICNEVILFAPQLELVQPNKLLRSYGCYYATFRGDNRACHIKFQDDQEYARASFFWGDGELFSFDVRNFEQLAQVMKVWLYDEVLPSGMRKQFPWLFMDQIADLYEQGEPDKGEFLRSWNQLEQFFREFNPQHWPQMPTARQFLVDLRSKGYHLLLRAGSSIDNLILSRSRRHGLERGQARIRFVFKFNNEGLDIYHNIGEEKIVKESIAEIACQDRVLELLNRLVEEPID